MNLPKELKLANRWLVTRNDKIPRYVSGLPRSGQLGTPEDLAQLADFDFAVNSLNSSNPFLGFALIAEDNIVFIDLDDVLDEHACFKSEDVHALVDKAYMAGAYVEVSMSGTGLHIFGKGFQQAFKKDGIEVYSEKRYCAITSKEHTDYPFRAMDLPDLNEIAEEFKALVKPVAEKKEKSSTPAERNLTLIQATLEHLDPDDREIWVKVGHALGRSYPNDAGVFELYRNWAGASPKFNAGRDEKAMRNYFFKDALLDRENAATFDTLVKIVKELGHSVYASELDELEPTEKQKPSIKFADRLSGALRINNWEIDKDAELAPPRFIVDVIHPYAAPTLLVGAGGTWKSTIALYEAFHIACGKDLYGMFPVREAGPVVLFLAEDDYDITHWRQKKIAERLLADEFTEDEMKLAYQNLIFVDANALIEFKLITQDKVNEYTITKQAKAFVDYFSSLDVKPKVYYFDPLVYFGLSEAQVNVSEPALMQAVKWMSKQLEASICLIHHMSKMATRNEIDDAHAGRGGSALGDNSRGVRVINKVKDHDAIRMAFAKNSYGKIDHNEIYVERDEFGFKGLTPEEWEDKYGEDPDSIAAMQSDRLADYIKSRNDKGEFPSKRQLKQDSLALINKGADKLTKISQKRIDEVLISLMDAGVVTALELETSKGQKYIGYQVNESERTF
jgi:RecA-family ATPase